MVAVAMMATEPRWEKEAFLGRGLENAEVWVALIPRHGRVSMSLDIKAVVHELEQSPSTMRW